MNHKKELLRGLWVVSSTCTKLIYADLSLKLPLRELHHYPYFPTALNC